MSLRYAILGFLSSTPASGYQLGREFAQGAGSYWSALPSQIYPELRELEKLGWISGEVSPTDTLKRRIFTLTPLGEAELRTWVEANNDYPPERDSERLRLIFLDGSSPDVIRKHLETHRTHHEQRLALWRSYREAVEKRTHRQLVRRLAMRPREDHELIVRLKLLALDGNIRRAELEIAWVDEALAWLDTLEREKRAGKSGRSAG
jgi:PadR family transcriptional regulator, regulator of vanillate utilization